MPSQQLWQCAWNLVVMVVQAFGCDLLQPVSEMGHIHSFSWAANVKLHIFPIKRCAVNISIFRSPDNIALCSKPPYNERGQLWKVLKAPCQCIYMTDPNGNIKKRQFESQNLFGILTSYKMSRWHDDAADEEGHAVGGGDPVLHGRDCSCHRLHSQIRIHS